MSMAKGDPGAYYHISSANTFQVKTGAGVLKRVVICANINGTTIIYDDVAGTANIMANLAANIAPCSIDFNCSFRTGLKVVTSGANVVTLIYE